MALGGSRRRRCRMTGGSRGGRAGRAGVVAILVSRGEGSRMAVAVKALNHRVEGRGVRRRISSSVAVLLLRLLFILLCKSLRLMPLQAAGISLSHLLDGILLIHMQGIRWRRVLPRKLPTLLFDPRQQALNLPVRRTEAARLDQVLQGCVKLSKWWQTDNFRRNNASALITDTVRSGAWKTENRVLRDSSPSLPAAAFGTGSCVKCFIRFGFKLKRFRGKLLCHFKILQCEKNKDRDAEIENCYIFPQLFTSQMCIFCVCA